MSKNTYKPVLTFLLYSELNNELSSLVWTNNKKLASLLQLGYTKFFTGFVRYFTPFLHKLFPEVCDNTMNCNVSFEIEKVIASNKNSISSPVADFKSLSIVVPLVPKKKFPSNLLIRTRCKAHSAITTGSLELQEVYGRSFVFSNSQLWRVSDSTVLHITIAAKLTEFDKEKDLQKFAWNTLPTELKVSVMEFLAAKSLCKMQRTCKVNCQLVTSNPSLNNIWFKLCSWNYRFFYSNSPFTSFQIEKNKFDSKVNWKNECKKIVTTRQVEQIVRVKKRNLTAVTVITCKMCKTVESNKAGEADLNAVEESKNYCN